ncbi:tetratricopeptide repeat protein [Aneurinibacillus terranovensis]|uniref:tetratricopeptide repeat protein n=1 Tax=Aneurinibacillus terranovensis TaxID=278991 RepID=UPI000414B194|nr:tetratricopeptide repeat protein [Aneurinibacillus terranovensis]
MYEQWQKELDTAMQVIENGNIEEGLMLLGELRNEAFGEPVLSLELVRLYHSLGHHTTALLLLDELDSWKDEHDRELRAEIQIYRASLYMDMDRLNEAMELLIELKETVTDDYRVYALLGELFLIEGLPEVAIRYFEQALEIDPGQEEIQYWAGKLYAELGESGRALSQWETMEGFDRNEQILLERAALSAKQGLFEEALELYERILKESGDHVEALYGCGVVAYQLGNWQQSISRFAKLLDVDEEYVAAYPLLAESLWKLGLKDKALAVYRQALQLQPEEEILTECYVTRLAELEKWDEVNEWATHLLEKDEEDMTAWYWRARVAEGEGDRELALQYYEYVIDSGEEVYDTAQRYAYLLEHL